jgi:hypothetical protein
LKSGKKIKILKYSNIEYVKESSHSKDRNIHTINKNVNRKKSQTSAGFSLENSSKQHEKSMTPVGNLKYSENHKNVHNFVDDDMDLPSFSKNSPEKSQKVPNLKNGQKENETIVPPLFLKNLSSNNKNAQNTGTGKLTRTTMNTTQIRDKIPLNNLKNNVNSEKSNMNNERR